MEKWQHRFQETLQDVEFSTLEDAKSELSVILGEAGRTLRGDSRSKYLVELTEVRGGNVDIKVSILLCN